MELYIIRHLQTEWNQRGVLQGSNDIDILPVSNEQQIEIAQTNQELNAIGNFDSIIVSELKRTHQTAKQYGYSEFSVESLINELNFGIYEGQPKERMISELGPSWYDDPRNLVLGEPIVGLAKRVELFLQKYEQSHRLLVFAHGSWTRAMISFVTIGSLKNMNKVTVENNQLVKLNYHVATAV